MLLSSFKKYRRVYQGNRKRPLIHEFKKICLLTVATLAFTIDDTLATASDPKKWQPAIHFGGKYGNQRRIGQFALFAPLAQSYTDLIYLDFRFVADSRSAKEGNFGLGKRWFTDDNQFILGFYGFYDRRHTELGNKVNQITLGFEAMSETWDYRVNAYCPENAVKEVEKSREVTEGAPRFTHRDAMHTEYYLVDKSLKITKTREVSLKGLDLEIGRSIPGLKQLRLYGAYYHFQGRAGAPSINGFRARANLELNKYVSVQFEGSHDKVRKTAGFVGISFCVPLGKQDSKAPPLSDLDKRMTEQPMRDIDIVTSTASMGHEVTLETVQKKLKVLSLEIDSTSTPIDGDGSFERPFDKGHKRHRKSIGDLIESNSDDPFEEFIVLKQGKVIRRVQIGEFLQELDKSNVTSISEHGASEVSERPPVADGEELRSELPKKRLVPVGEEGRVRKKLAKPKMAEQVRVAADEQRVRDEEDRIEAERLDEVARLAQVEKERVEREAEVARLAQVEKERVEREAEVARLAQVEKERVEREAEVARLAQVEKERVEREAEVARLAQVEKERVEREAEVARLAQVEKERVEREAEVARLAQVEKERVEREAEAARVEKEQREAATTLQSVFKGRQARQELANLKAAEVARQEERLLELEEEAVRLLPESALKAQRDEVQNIVEEARQEDRLLELEEEAARLLSEAALKADREEAQELALFTAQKVARDAELNAIKTQGVVKKQIEEVRQAEIQKENIRIAEAEAAQDREVARIAAENLAEQERVETEARLKREEAVRVENEEARLAADQSPPPRTPQQTMALRKSKTPRSAVRVKAEDNIKLFIPPVRSNSIIAASMSASLDPAAALLSKDLMDATGATMVVGGDKIVFVEDKDKTPRPSPNKNALVTDVEQARAALSVSKEKSPSPLREQQEDKENLPPQSLDRASGVTGTQLPKAEDKGSPVRKRLFEKDGEITLLDHTHDSPMSQYVLDPQQAASRARSLVASERGVFLTPPRPSQPLDGEDTSVIPVGSDGVEVDHGIVAVDGTPQHIAAREEEDKTPPTVPRVRPGIAGADSSVPPLLHLKEQSDVREAPMAIIPQAITLPSPVAPASNPSEDGEPISLSAGHLVSRERVMDRAISAVPVSEGELGDLFPTVSDSSMAAALNDSARVAPVILGPVGQSALFPVSDASMTVALTSSRIVPAVPVSEGELGDLFPTVSDSSMAAALNDSASVAPVILGPVVGQSALFPVSDASMTAALNDSGAVAPVVPASVGGSALFPIVSDASMAIASSHSGLATAHALPNAITPATTILPHHGPRQSIISSGSAPTKRGLLDRVMGLFSRSKNTNA